MITRSDPTKHLPEWQKQLAQAISDPQLLLHTLGLDQTLLPELLQADKLFRLRAPRAYVARIKKGDINDPLLRQILPLNAETQHTPGFIRDPVHDLDAVTVPGILQKYHGRVLLLTTGACGIHCRFCFRRHFPYGENSLSGDRLSSALRHIAADSSIQEVILSGGDPLSLTDDRLSSLTSRLASIPHLRRLRIHTRQPIVLPARVDDTLLTWLNTLRLHKIMVVHTNHPNEIDAAVSLALKRLRSADVRLLNQAVLLQGVNDSVKTLAELSEALFEVWVQPYYLHLLDKVEGAAHFDVTKERALELLHKLSGRLPGYLVPRLVCEQAGTPSKTFVI